MTTPSTCTCILVIVCSAMIFAAKTGPLLNAPASSIVLKNFFITLQPNLTAILMSLPVVHYIKLDKFAGLVAAAFFLGEAKHATHFLAANPNATKVALIFARGAQFIGQGYKDPQIAASWRQELVELRERKMEPLQLADNQIDYLFAELEWYAQQRLNHIAPGKNVVPIEIGIDGTRKADGLVPSELKSKLLAGVQKLMDVPQHQKDWHPGSNKQVLDLVHPSLFPFIAGRTLVVEGRATPPLQFVGKGKTMEMAPMKGGIDEQYYSEKYQWLPTNCVLDDKGKVQFESYINNLHPVEHQDLYPVLSEILEKFLPMFEDVLTDMRALPKKGSRFHADPYGWYANSPEDQDDFETDSAYDEAMDEWYQNRIPSIIEIPKFHSPEEPERYEFQPGQKIQVIVKLANIELTPACPAYDGGVWHVEGMANENIVATGIYYYHSNNITETRLNFRIHVQEPGYEQSDERGVMAMYGLANDQALVQYLDGIVTKEDRCIAFPNIYQHQVQPFKLEDPTQPGTRKILVFFLVNPETPVLSTSQVPPQQKAWAANDTLMQQVARKLPPELVNEIDKLVDWPMEMDEALTHREELMKQRKFFVSSMNEEMFERPFSLCEH
ncbi:hypothetical protein BG004_000893 [Podila humilis]|nr:hypothetical protein BG004_000893 [Podila humilis]